MWAYVQTERIESDVAGKYRALVTLSDDGVMQSFYLKFQAQPEQATIDALAAVYAATLNRNSADAEFSAVVASDHFPATPKYQTKTEFAGRFRIAYKTATAAYVLRLAYWLIERIKDGTFTDAQVRNVFNLTVPQYAALKTRATTKHDAYQVAQTATGE